MTSIDMYYIRNTVHGWHRQLGYGHVQAVVADKQPTSNCRRLHAVSGTIHLLLLAVLVNQ